MLGLIILIISIYLDGLFSLILPYIPGQLSLFTPMLTLVSLLIIFPLYRKKEKKYFITLFITGIIYDLLYTNLLFYNALVFVLFGFIIKFIYENLDVSSIKLIFYEILIIVAYELLISLFILIFNLVPISINEIVYKITHSLLLNLIYSELLYLVIKIIPKRYKRISIN